MLGRRFGFVTPGEMFSSYFRSDLIRILVVIVALVFTVPFLGLQLRASGFLFNVLMGLQVETGMWMLAAVMSIYVASGGLRAVAYVDSFVSVLVGVGIVVIGIVAVSYVGGWGKLNEGIAALAQVDTQRTPDGYSHYVAIPGVIQFVSEGPQATGGAWTGIMILTYMFALMGIQSSPAFSMWAFSNRNPKPFAPQQVWASSLVIGFILIVFTAMQGLASHLLGADVDNQDMLVPQLLNLVADTVPWLVGLLAVSALAAMQSAGAAYTSTAAGMLARDLLKRFVMPKASYGQQKFWGVVGVVVIMAAALAVAINTKDALVLLGGLAVAYGFQMWPSLIAVCWCPWLTRAGCIWGLIAGLIAVTLTDTIGQEWFGIEAWGRWPWTIHSAGWGIVFNLAVAIIVSAFTQDEDDRKHHMTYHDFLRAHASVPTEKRALVPTAWVITLVWFFFGIGPGAVIGNTIFGNPNDMTTWVFGMPSIWAWQILWWALGVFMMWFLAYKMELSTVPDKEIVALREDVGDIHLDTDQP